MPNLVAMKKIFFLLIVSAIGLSAYAQQGKVEIIGAEEIDQAIEDKLERVDSTDLWGYRIQVYFGSDRKKANTMAQKFKMRYPDLRDEVYMDYFQPNWRVRVGNFHRKIDAQKQMHMLEEEFGDVFLVRDKIELPFIE
jgi:hypothetical protein